MGRKVITFCLITVFAAIFIFAYDQEESIYFQSENQTDSLVAGINKLEPGINNLFVFHIGLDTPEMAAMYDLNSFGLPDMSKHRNAELNALCSPEFKNSLKSNNIQLITYQDLIAKVGLNSLKIPDQ